jgi:hypothetical protein
MFGNKKKENIVVFPANQIQPLQEPRKMIDFADENEEKVNNKDDIMDTRINIANEYLNMKQHIKNLSVEERLENIENILFSVGLLSPK